MSYAINPVLFDIAEWRLAGEREKQAFVPAGGDPAAGGGAPPGMDPAAMGGMPPGMDPAAMGGAPPMDPMTMAMGGPPPGPPAPAPAPAPAPGAAPAPGQPGAPGAAKPKIDPTFIYMELSRVRKLLTHLLKSTGVELPPDILDDGSVAQVVQGQQPQSSPLGQEPQQAPPGGGGLPSIGQSSGINPIEPAGQKQGSDLMSLFTPPSYASTNNFRGLGSRLDALSALSRSLMNR